MAITKEIVYSDTDNKRLSMMVHDNGTAHMWVHNVASVKLSKWKKEDKPYIGKLPYKTKTLEVTQVDGKKVRIDLFAVGEPTAPRGKQK